MGFSSWGFDKQPCSRPLTNTYTLTYAGGASGGPTVFTTSFKSGTQHIRVISTLAGWGAVEQSTSSLIMSSSSIPGVGMIVPASTVGGEYFTITPGQFFSFCSTSTATGYVVVTEMA